MGGISTGVFLVGCWSRAPRPWRGCGGPVAAGVTHYWVVDQQTRHRGGAGTGREAGSGVPGPLVEWWCWWLVGFRSVMIAWCVPRGGGVGGLLFVNYIVDASIFDAAQTWSHDDHDVVLRDGVVVVWWVCVVCSLMIVLCCVA